MGPPPIHRRHMSGEDITPDQVKFAGGLGIRGAMDREQYTHTQNHFRGSHAGLSDYRSQSDTYPSLSASHLGQNTLAYDSRSSALYTPASYSGTQYMTGLHGYSNDTNQYSRSTTVPSTLELHRTSGMQEQPYSTGPTSTYAAGTSRYSSSYTDDSLRSDMDRYGTTGTFGGQSSMYAGSSGYITPGTRYNDAQTGRSLLLSEPTGTSNNLISSWTPTSISTIDPPRSS